MLYTGEKLGLPVETSEPLCAVVDPLECTSNFARGLPDSVSVLMVARKGTIVPVPGSYMEQLLLPAELKDMSSISLDMKPSELLPLVAGALEMRVPEITVVVQDRPRHQELIEQIRETGAGVALIESGSISAAAEIIRRKEGRYTMLWGTFGAPEGLIISFMAKASGFRFLGRVQPHNEKTEQEAEKYGILGRTLSQDEWVKQDAILLISGIHSSVWLDGVRRIKIKHPQNRLLDMNVPRWRYLVSTVVWTMNSVEIVEQENGDLRRRRPFFA
jgi:fructose-1,6-bisphosphatase/sedoheptulose 1,7-bisphosphatase-like protein